MNDDYIKENLALSPLFKIGKKERKELKQTMLEVNAHQSKTNIVNEDSYNISGFYFILFLQYHRSTESKTKSRFLE